MSRKSLIVAAMFVFVAVTSGIVVADSDFVNANVSERPVCVPNQGQTEVSVDTFGEQAEIDGADVILLAKDDDGYYYKLSDVRGVTVKPAEELTHNFTVDWPKNDETFDELGKGRSKIVASPIPEKNYTLVVAVNAHPDEGWVIESENEGDAALGTCAADGDDGGAPGWIPLQEPTWWDNAKDVLTNPLEWLRGAVYDWLLTGIAQAFTPIFGALSLIFFGSNPDIFAAEGEVLGLLDIPVFIVKLIAGLIEWSITTYFDVVTSLIESVIPQTAGPISGVIAMAAAVGIVIVVLETARRLILASIEAIPYFGGPLRSLLLGD